MPSNSLCRGPGLSSPTYNLHSCSLELGFHVQYAFRSPTPLFQRQRNQDRGRVLTRFPVAYHLQSQVLNRCLFRAGSHLVCFLSMATRSSTNAQENLCQTHPFQWVSCGDKAFSWNVGWILRPTLGLDEGALSPVCLSFPTHKQGMIQPCGLT
jgi:hypothetical protein